MTYNLELETRISTWLEGKKGITRRKMFGGVGFMLNGNMLTGVIKDDLILRMSEEEAEKALKQAHVRVFDYSGRPMAGWLMVAPEGYAGKKLDDWLKQAFEDVQTLPPK